MSGSLSGALGIASGGLSNVALGLSVVSQNVANASTPQYALETLTQTSQSAAGQGFGVRSGVVVLATDPGLQSQVSAQNSALAADNTTSAALATLEPVLGTVGAGTDLGSRLAAVQSAFGALQADPADPIQQGAVVDAATNLASGINALAGAYGDARQTAQNGIVSGVDQLNTALANLGKLSAHIVNDRAQGLSTADLENQRAQAEAAVSGLVDARFLPQPNGDVTVLSAGGAQLPTDGTKLVATPATTGALVSYPGGGIPGILLGGSDITRQLTGGSIGANLTLRDQTLPTYQAGLDQFAQTLSGRFAAQGLTLFTDAAGIVPVATGPQVQTGYVGYATTIQVNPAVTATPALGTRRYPGDRRFAHRGKRVHAKSQRPARLRHTDHPRAELCARPQRAGRRAADTSGDRRPGPDRHALLRLRRAGNADRRRQRAHRRTGRRQRPGLVAGRRYRGGADRLAGQAHGRHRDRHGYRTWPDGGAAECLRC